MKIVSILTLLFISFFSFNASAATRNLNIVVAYPTAAAFHAYGLILSRHIDKHLPNNYKIFLRNMPGASGLVAINWIYAHPAEENLTVVLGNGTVTTYDSFAYEGAKYNAKELNYIGSMVSEIPVCHIWHEANITSIKDAQVKEVIVGESAYGTKLVPLLNKAIGTKFKVVGGYPGSNEAFLAMERREVDGRCGASWSGVVAAKSDWLENKKTIPILQIGTTPHPDLANVPLAIDLATTKEYRNILETISIPNYAGRVVFAGPKMKLDDVTLLRKAFNNTMIDKEFLDEANKLKIEISPLKGEELERLVEKVQSTHPDILKEAAKAF